MSTGRASSVGTGSSLLLLKDILAQSLSIFFYAVVARVLTISDVGLLTVITMIVMMVSYFGTFGLPEAASRYIPSMRMQNNPGASGFVSRVVLGVGILVGLVAFVFLVYFADDISSILFGTTVYAWLIPIVGIDSGAALMISNYRGVQKGWQDFHSIAVSETLLTIAKVGLGLAFIMLGYGVPGVAVGWMSGDLLGILAYSFFAWKNIASRTERIPLSPIARFAFPVYLSLIVEYIATYIDRFILLQYRGLEDLAFLTSAITIVGIGSLVYGSAGSAIYPELSRIHASAGQGATVAYARRASKFVLFLSLPVLLGIASISNLLVVFMLGTDFAPAGNPLVPIAIATGVVSLSAVTNPLALSLGRARYILEGNLVGAVLCAIISFWLIPLYGVDGAVVARVTLLLATQLYVWLRIFVTHGNPVAVKPLVSIWLCAILMLIVVLLARHSFDNLTHLPLLVLLGVATYAFSTRFAKILGARDCEVLLEILPERIRGFARRVLHVICTGSEEK